jgi:hypothetical protein
MLTRKCSAVATSVFIELVATARKIVMRTRFLVELGQVVITPGALLALAKDSEDLLIHLDRHASGDSSLLEEYDDDEEEVVRVVSIQRLTSGEPLWISSDRNRKTTTVMLREEYSD